MRSVTSSRFFSVFRLLAVAGALSLAAGLPAEAAKKKGAKKEYSQRKAKKKAAGGGGGYAPPYAALVVDAKSGKVLHSENADAIRHPASLTKVMTLYVLFDELDRGTVKLDTPLTVSAEAARQAPSKLGLRPGETIKVEDAIKALVTKSANDVAVTVAENISGSQDAFAARMTRKARALGMTSTVYRNASGLPDPGQITTARDLALLGRAIQDNHPTYYRYFSTRSFVWRGQNFGNHNKLLGRVQGVDGIKTGFIRASGFNLLTSAKDDGRQVVAVVLGGRSGASRDARMRDLVMANLPKATGGGRTAPLIAEAPVSEPAPQLGTTSARASAPSPAPVVAARALPAPRPLEMAATVQPTPPQPVQHEVAALPAPVAASVVPQAQPIVTGSASMTPDVIAHRIAVATAMATTTPSQDLRWVVGAQAAAASSSALGYAGGTTPGSPGPRDVAAPRPQPVAMQTAPVQAALQIGAPVHPAQLTVEPAAPSAPPPQVASLVPLSPKPSAAPAAPARLGWIIQIGATPDPAQAQTLLDRASGAVRSADRGASPFTESVQKDGVTLYRARFAGFSERSAAQACKAVKRASLSCFTLKN